MIEDAIVIIVVFESIHSKGKLPGMFLAPD